MTITMDEITGTITETLNEGIKKLAFAGVAIGVVATYGVAAMLCKTGDGENCFSMGNSVVQTTVAALITGGIATAMNNPAVRGAAMNGAARVKSMWSNRHQITAPTPHATDLNNQATVTPPASPTSLTQ